MAYERKEGDFVLNRNKNKKSDKSPDYMGKILWEGKDVELVAWERNGTNGLFISGRISQEMPDKKPAYKPQDEAPSRVKMDDGIPF